MSEQLDRAMKAFEEEFPKQFCYDCMLSTPSLTECMKAAIAAATEWQEITEAHKTGEEMLIARGERMAVAFWSEGKWRCGGHLYFNNPTHVIPKPAPPEPEEK